MAITFPANGLWVVTDLDGTLLEPMYIVENGGEVVVPAERSPTSSNGASM